MLKEQDYGHPVDTNTVLPDMADKLQVLETQIIPQFGEAFRKLSDIAERVGYQLPLSTAQDKVPYSSGYVGNLANSLDALRGQGESLNALLDELNRFI